MSTICYERPTIVRHEAGRMNKLARAGSVLPLSEIDDVSCHELVRQHGSALFVFSERALVARYHEFNDALSRQFPRVQLAWSYKTNYLDAICRVLHREGAWAEVVSAMEYDKARRLGVPGSRIVFNGPYKPEPALARAFGEGSRVNLDNFDEILRAENAAASSGTRPRVGIRLNMTVPGTPPWSRFGFNLENGQAIDAVQRILAGGKLELAGLHCHLGTFIQDVESYRVAARRLAEFANRLLTEHGLYLDSIDVGGGFASKNTLHAQYLPGEQVTPSFGQYSEALSDGLSALSYPPDRRPLIIVESGRALIDDAGYLITTVHASKRLPDGRRALVVDAGVNALFTSFWYKHDVLPAQECDGTAEPTVIFGPLCMNIDVIRDQLAFPPVNPGDLLVVRSVGAYNCTQWMQFIVERPAVVMISPRREVAVIRRRESLQTLLDQEEMPPWL